MDYKKTKIFSTGSFMPENVITNSDLEKMVDTSDEWISSRTGIKKRHIAHAKEAASDLAYHASIKTLAKAGMSAKDLDMIIVATITPDMLFPATACLLQHRLGVKKIPAFDLEAACSGFIYGVSIASQFIGSGTYENILVVASETLSKITDWTDRNTCVIFADGAGAALLRPSDDGSGIVSVHLGADGGDAALVEVPAGGSRMPASIQTIQDRQHYMKMKGNELFKRAINVMVEAADIAIEKAGLTFKDIDLFIPHQANIRIIQAVAKKTNIPMEKVYLNLHECGNMSAASVVVALDQAIEEEKIKKGDKILFACFGGGLTWGSMLLEW